MFNNMKHRTASPTITEVLVELLCKHIRFLNECVLLKTLYFGLKLKLGF